MCCPPQFCHWLNVFAAVCCGLECYGCSERQDRDCRDDLSSRHVVLCEYDSNEQCFVSKLICQSQETFQLVLVSFLA